MSMFSFLAENPSFHRDDSDKAASWRTGHPGPDNPGNLADAGILVPGPYKSHLELELLSLLFDDELSALSEWSELSDVLLLSEADDSSPLVVCAAETDAILHNDIDRHIAAVIRTASNLLYGLRFFFNI